MADEQGPDSPSLCTPARAQAELKQHHSSPAFNRDRITTQLAVHIIVGLLAVETK